MQRRLFLTLLSSAAAVSYLGLIPDAMAETKPKKIVKKKKVRKSAAKKPFVVNPKYAPQRVAYTSRYKRGTIVIETGKRFLYLVESPLTARRYGVGVGREALAWSGTATIDVKKEWPSWRPTDEMIGREPEKYAQYIDGMPGGPTNPLGARALYLFDKGYDTFYRIHGTTQPQSIGTASSNGCIRMVNDHVIDLYDRVPIGTTVVVL